MFKKRKDLKPIPTTYDNEKLMKYCTAYARLFLDKYYGYSIDPSTVNDRTHDRTHDRVPYTMLHYPFLDGSGKCDMIQFDVFGFTVRHCLIHINLNTVATWDQLHDVLIHELIHFILWSRGHQYTDHSPTFRMHIAYFTLFKPDINVLEE